MLSNTLRRSLRARASAVRRFSTRSWMNGRLAPVRAAVAAPGSWSVRALATEAAHFGPASASNG